MNNSDLVQLNMFGRTHFKRDYIQQMPDNISGIYMVYQVAQIDGKEYPTFTYFGLGNIKDGLLQCLDNQAIYSAAPFQQCAYWEGQSESTFKNIISTFNPKVK